MRPIALFIALATLTPASALAQDVIYSGTLRGELVATGNTLGLDSSGATTPGTGGGIGTFIANPIDFASAVEGTFPTGTTADFNQNGSAAILDLPASATIVNAQLVWACSSQNGGSPVTPVTTPPEVSLTLPSGARQTITPAASNTNITLISPDYEYYQRHADVTSAVTTGGAGRYMVSRVAGSQFVDLNFVSGCGWTLFVVYAHPDLPMRNITLWSIGQEVRDDDNAACPCESQIDVTGFCTPPDEGTANGRLVVTSLEGDAKFTDDMLMILDPLFPGEFYPLSGPNNAWNNFFASQINGEDGLLDTRGTFGNVNHSVDPLDGTDFTLVSGARQSWDITTIPLNDDEYNAFVLENGQSATSFVATTGGIDTEGDDYIIVAMGLALDFESPDLISTHVVDRTWALMGDVVTYTFTLLNEGSGRADQVAFCFEGSANSTFLDMTLEGAAQPSATAQTLAPANCQANGGHLIGAFEPLQEKTITLRYRVDTLTPAPSLGDKVSGTPSWRLEWRPDCVGADFEIDRQTGTTAVVPGVMIQATLTVNPTTPPAVATNTVLTYTLTITNLGSADSSADIIARLGIPANTVYVANSTTFNGAAVPDQGGMPFTTARPVNSPGAPSGVIAAGGSAVIVFQVRIDADEATTVTQTGFFDVDGAGPNPETASNTVSTSVLGPPTPNDRDRDGIPDETDNCPDTFNPDQADNYPPPSGNGIGDACDDVDRDGILDLDEDLGPDDTRDTADDTDPMNPDTDGDGLCDGSILIAPCVGVEDTDGDFDGNDRGTTETDPTNPDTDGDGLCDGRNNGGDCLGGESDLGTDPLDTDSDDDGLCDGPGGGDWDDSGCVGGETGDDGDLDPGVDTDPTNPDTDGDGLCDGFNNGSPLCRGAEDQDGDRDVADFGHPGGTESNPLNPDTDGGGVRDGVEFDNGTNPRDPCEGDNQDCNPTPVMPDMIARGGACSGGNLGGLLGLLGGIVVVLGRRRFA